MLKSKWNSYFSFEDAAIHTNVEPISTDEIRDIAQTEVDINNDIATLEENTEIVNELIEQNDEIQEVVESSPASVTPEVVQEHNTRFLITLGRLGAGDNDISNIKIGTESSSLPLQQLKVTQEGIIDTIKEFFKKAWEWIKKIAKKIVDWFKNLFGFTKKKEQAIAEVKITPEVKTKIETVEKVITKVVEKKPEILNPENEVIEGELIEEVKEVIEKDSSLTKEIETKFITYQSKSKNNLLDSKIKVPSQVQIKEKIDYNKKFKDDYNNAPKQLGYDPTASIAKAVADIIKTARRDLDLLCPIAAVYGDKFDIEDFEWFFGKLSGYKSLINRYMDDTKYITINSIIPLFHTHYSYLENELMSKYLEMEDSDVTKNMLAEILPHGEFVYASIYKTHTDRWGVITHKTTPLPSKKDPVTLGNRKSLDVITKFLSARSFLNIHKTATASRITRVLSIVTDKSNDDLEKLEKKVHEQLRTYGSAVGSELEEIEKHKLYKTQLLVELVKIDMKAAVCKSKLINSLLNISSKIAKAAYL